MDLLIRQLRVSLCKDCGGQLHVAIGLVTKIVEQLRKDKVPSSSVKEVALEIVEAVLAELPPSGQKMTNLLHPLIPAAIDAGIPFGVRCFSWLSSVFLPKARVKPVLTSVVTPRLLPVLAASQGVVAASVQCAGTPPPLSIVHDGPLPNVPDDQAQAPEDHAVVPDEHAVVPEDHAQGPEDQILSVDEEPASEKALSVSEEQASEKQPSQLEMAVPVLSTRELKFDLD